MALHRVEYNYMIPEWGTIELEMDEDLPMSDKEELAIRELQEEFSDIADIMIDKIEIV